MTTIGGIFLFGICVILPIAIVWLIVRARQNQTNREAEVLLRSMETGHPIDKDTLRQLTGRGVAIKFRLLILLTAAFIATLLGVAFLVLAFVEVAINPPKLDFDYIMTSGIFLAIGIAFFLAYFIGKRMLAKEIEAEEQDGEYRK